MGTKYCNPSSVWWPRPLFDHMTRISDPSRNFALAMPIEGHYQVALFNSGAGLLWDDNRPPTRLVRDREFFQNIYMLWLAPWNAIRQEYRCPLPFVSNNRSLEHLKTLQKSPRCFRAAQHRRILMRPLAAEWMNVFLIVNMHVFDIYIYIFFYCIFSLVYIIYVNDLCVCNCMK